MNDGGFSVRSLIVEGLCMDAQLGASCDPHTITLLDTADTLEVYSTVAIEDQPQQFMRLNIRRR